MKRLTPFQEAHLAYCVEHKDQFRLHLPLRAGNGVRSFPSNFYGRVISAFLRVGVAYKEIDPQGWNTTILDFDKAQAYVDKYGCTSDLLYVEKQQLTEFDRAQLAYLINNVDIVGGKKVRVGKLLRYHLFNYRYFTWWRYRESVVRLLSHNLIKESNWHDYKPTPAGLAYNNEHPINYREVLQ